MSDINRFLIFLILIGLLFSLYKYQDIIMENVNSIQQSLSPQQEPLQIKPLQSTNTNNNNVTVDNISQISLSSIEGNNILDSLSNSDNMSDLNTFDTRMSKQTYGSLFED
jgi:hypothetical protein